MSKLSIFGGVFPVVKVSDYRTEKRRGKGKGK